MTKQDLIGAVITLTLMPCIVGAWMVYHIRGGK
jgi:hypothetical protein